MFDEELKVTKFHLFSDTHFLMTRSWCSRLLHYEELDKVEMIIQGRGTHFFF